MLRDNGLRQSTLPHNYLHKCRCEVETELSKKDHVKIKVDEVIQPKFKTRKIQGWFMQPPKTERNNCNENNNQKSMYFFWLMNF